MDLRALLAALGRVVDQARLVSVALRLRDLPGAMKVAGPLDQAIEQYDRLVDDEADTEE